MSIADRMLQGLVQGSDIVRGRVAGIDAEARLVVQHMTDRATEWHCDVLETGPQPMAFDLGDIVLVLARPEAGGDGIVLGRVARAARAPEAPAAAPTSARPTPGEAPATEKRIVIEADEEIVLRVGESSIRIARDGKVVIRGHHVLTRAKGTNRIKGGSVAIN